MTSSPRRRRNNDDVSPTRPEEDRARGRRRSPRPNASRVKRKSQMDDIELELQSLHEKKEQAKRISDATGSRPSLKLGGLQQQRTSSSRSLSPRGGRGGGSSSRRNLLSSSGSMKQLSQKNLFSKTAEESFASGMLLYDDSDGEEDTNGPSSASSRGIMSRNNNTLSLLSKTGDGGPNDTSTNTPILPGSPRDRLNQIFGGGDEPTWLVQETSSFTWDKYFQEEDDETQSSQNKKKKKLMPDDLEMAIQTKDLDQLQHLWECGVSMDCRNHLGESVAHLVCRECCLEQLQFLIRDAKVNLRVRDHAHKTVLHEIAWNPHFEPQMVTLILTHAPELLWATDCRQFIPLDYVPRRVQKVWYTFLETKRSSIQQSLVISRCKDNIQQFNASLHRLQSIVQVHQDSKNRTISATTAATAAAAAAVVV